MHTRASKRALQLMGIVLVGFLIIVLAFSESETASTTTTNATKAQPYVLSSSTIPVRVSGVVEASDRAVIGARQSGMLEAVFVQEGSMVTKGAVLARQDTSVAGAGVALARAEGAVATGEQQALEHAAAASRERAAALASSAEAEAGQNAEKNDNRVQEVAQASVVTFHTSVSSLVQTLEFVDQHRSLFDAAALEQYRSIVIELYGDLPSHYSGFRVGRPDSREILAVLDEVSTRAPFDPARVEEVGTLIAEQLERLAAVYTSAEEEVLDRQKVDPDSALYAAYWNAQQTVLTARTKTEQALAGVKTAEDAARTDALQNGRSVAVTSIDRERSIQSSALRTDVLRRAEQAAQAAQAKALAEQALGTVYAPFAGTVSQTFKRTGEYVQAGEPLLLLTGVSGAELSVHVPAQFLPLLRAGVPFVRDGTTIGVVDRFSTTQRGNSILVVITLAETAVPVGGTLHGELMFESSDTVYAIPRAAMQFSAEGPYVVDIQGVKHPVALLYDSGAIYYVEGEGLNGVALVFTYSSVR